MTDLFASLYETFLNLYNQKFVLIFSALYDGGGYTELALSFIVIPFLFWFLFYYLWTNPYGRLWHWIVWLVVISVIVFAVSYAVADNKIFASNDQALNNALADTSTGYQNFAASLPFNYAFYNSIFALILGLIYSLIMKQWSKKQIHLPI
jgi:hypothetical protein